MQQLEDRRRHGEEEAAEAVPQAPRRGAADAVAPNSARRPDPPKRGPNRPGKTPDGRLRARPANYENVVHAASVRLTPKINLGLSCSVADYISIHFCDAFIGFFSTGNLYTRFSLGLNIPRYFTC